MPQGGTDGWAGCGRERGCSYTEGARALEGGVAVTECSSPAGFQGKSASPVLEVRLDTRAHVSRVRLLGSVQTRSGCEAEVGLCWHLDGPGAWSLRLVTCQLGVCREGEAGRLWRTGAGGAQCSGGWPWAAGWVLDLQLPGLWGSDRVLLVTWRRYTDVGLSGNGVQAWETSASTGMKSVLPRWPLRSRRVRVLGSPSIPGAVGHELGETWPPAWFSPTHSPLCVRGSLDSIGVAGVRVLTKQ